MTKLKNKQPTMDEAINSYCNEAVSLIRGLAKRTVEVYYKIGKMAKDIDTNYGEEGLEKFGSQLREQSPGEVGLSNSSIYRMRQFASKHTESQLQVMIESGITWNQIVKTLPQPEEVVSQVLDGVASGEINAQEVANEVQNRVAPDRAPDLDPDLGEPTEKGSNSEKSSGGPTTTYMSKDPADISKLDGSRASCARELKRISKYLEELNDSMGNLLIVCDQLNQMNDDDLTELSEDISELQRQFKLFNKVGKEGYTSIMTFEIE